MLQRDGLRMLARMGFGLVLSCCRM